MENRYSSVIVRGEEQRVKVKIGSKLKPQVVDTVFQKWQDLLDVVVKLVQVPSGLIMKLNESTIEVFQKSSNEENPYEVGEEADLVYGLYCETVIGKQQHLIVPDATMSSLWKVNNPDIDLNMISYIGLPVNWPDGEVFGTVCLLDSKENNYSSIYIDLINQVKQFVESDLRILVANQKLEESNKELQDLNAIKSKFLSLISHDVRGGVGLIDEFLMLTISELDHYEKHEIKTILESLRQNASSSYLILENLLSWSKHDLLKLKPKLISINLSALLDDLLGYFQQIILMKNITIVKEFQSQMAIVFADENMLRTVLRNLISNGIKYSNKHGKLILRLFSNENKITIEVEDEGIGIKKEVLDKLFSYNPSHEPYGTYGESSAGIGLIIIKEFLDKMDASITVTSEVDIGTKFRIEF